MYFLALAVDYDGTIAKDGVVDASTVRALETLKATGRRLILVTGRDLESLRSAFHPIKLFDRVVAENGALIYDPATHRERLIASPPSSKFIDVLRRRGVTPLSVGRSIVATKVPNEKVVLEVIQELGAELQIVFNKGAVMVLPAGTNKASGLREALAEVKVSPLNVVGAGDAENDHAFLLSCGCAVAVANALPSIREQADICLTGDHGAGIVELVNMICRMDAGMVPPQRHGVLVGRDRDGMDVYLEPHVGSALIAGGSVVETSALAAALVQNMVAKTLQFCLIDTEGHYKELPPAISTGDSKSPPVLDEVLAILGELETDVMVRTQGLSGSDRSALLAKLLPQILSLRAHTGRPQWILMDDARHLTGPEHNDDGEMLPPVIPAAILATGRPETMASSVLRTVEYVLAAGDAALPTLQLVCQAIGIATPAAPTGIDEGEVLFWARSTGESPHPVKIVVSERAFARHKTIEA